MTSLLSLNENQLSKEQDRARIARAYRNAHIINGIGLIEPQNVLEAQWGEISHAMTEQEFEDALNLLNEKPILPLDKQSFK